MLLLLLACSCGFHSQSVASTTGLELWLLQPVCGFYSWPMAVTSTASLWLLQMAYVIGFNSLSISVASMAGLWLWLLQLTYGFGFYDWPKTVASTNGLWLWLLQLVCGIYSWPVAAITVPAPHSLPGAGVTHCPTLSCTVQGSTVL